MIGEHRLVQPHRRVQGVPAERQVGRQPEGRLADQPAGDQARLDPTVGLLQRPAATVLQPDPDLDLLLVLEMHLERRPAALPA